VSGFRADVDELAGLVARLVVFERRCAELAEELDGQVRRLNGAWNGAAADAHARAHREWMAGDARMRSAAAGLRGYVARTRENYCAAATANARMWG
jgi:uncharacterized protein YukE